MPKDNTPADMYEALRNYGFQLESRLNELIHKHLNKKEIALAAGFLAKEHARLIEKLHQYQETISIQLNVPTKKDVANLAKLILQTEEKIDDLADKILKLTEALEQMKEHSYNRTVPIYFSNQESSPSLYVNESHLHSHNAKKKKSRTYLRALKAMNAQGSERHGR